MMIFGISVQALFGQLLVGLINGSMYALLSLGLAIIFGMLRVVNFAHGAFYMLGAFAIYLLGQHAGLGYWPSLIVAPLLVAVFGAIIERVMLRRLYGVDHLYGILLTFGMALVLEGLFIHWFGTGGEYYAPPQSLSGAINLGFIVLPIYRAWVILIALLVSVGIWLLIEKTRMGSYLRAATHDAALVQALGINVPLLMTLTFALSVGLAAFAGALSAPLFQVTSTMGQHLIIVIFAIVVIGGMGSIKGAIITGFALGICEGLVKFFYPPAAGLTVFVLMVLVLLVRPEGLFGGGASAPIGATNGDITTSRIRYSRATVVATMAGIIVLVALLPFLVYPLAAVNLLCMVLFAAAFNLLLGFVGLASFGHAAFFGLAAYTAAYSVKTWGFTAEAALILAMVFASLLGLAMGFLAIRRKGIYFAMITLALAEMFYFICLRVPLTGGDEGIQGVPPARLFGIVPLDAPIVKYYFTAVLVLAGLWVVWRVVHSPFGYVLQSIRDNEARAISLGYRVERFKLGAFVISATLSGLAGGLKAISFQFASLNDASWQMSGDVLLATLLGGIGTMLGPVVGAGITVGLDRFLATSALPSHVVLGVVFILAVLLFRRGVVGTLLPGLMAERNSSTPRQPRSVPEAG